MQGNHTLLSYARTVGASLEGRLTRVEAIRFAYEAYRAGRLDGDVHELHAVWAQRREPQLTREQRVAVRIAEYTEAAAETNAKLGRPTGYRYCGGPVDWQTGMPAGSACAWVRSAPFRKAPTPA